MLKYINPTTTNSLPYWKTIDDIMQGSDGIRKGGELYLPKENSETKESYNARLKKGTFLDFYNPTLDGISGLIFKKPIVYSDDIPTQSQSFIENADMMGNHFDIIIENLFKGALNKGISFAMLDLPKGEAPKSQAEQTQRGIKPYIVNVAPENVTSWKTETINGQIVLTQVKIREWVEVDNPDNPYATETVEQWRILEIGTFEVYQETDGKEILIEDGFTNLDFIPLYSLNLNKKGFFASFPTFYDLSQLNIAHYQIFSDSRHSAHISSVPMMKFIGFEANEVKKIPISANTAITTNNVEADVSWLDYEGKGVAVNKTLTDTLEMKMREIGLSVISLDKTVTATEVSISATQSQSKLNTYVRSLIDTAELILLGVAKMYGLDEGGSVDIDADILSMPLSFNEVNTLNAMVTSGNMSIEQMYKVISSGSFRISEDFDIEVMKEEIGSDGLLNNEGE